MPLFSIIIPVYNVAPYLRECLDSVVAQTFTDWEAICVDDGSTDGSGAILDEYAARDKRFRVLHQSNAGVSAARNAALDVVTGEWFLFLDGDDLLRKDALATFEPYADKMQDLDGILIHPYVDWWSGDKIPAKKIQTHVLVENASKEDLFLGKYAANGYPFSRVYRKCRFGHLRFRVDLALSEDVCFWFDALCLNAKWIILNAEYYLYRQRADSAIGTMDQRRWIQALDAVLHAVRAVDIIMGPASDCKRRYLRRFPFSVVNFLNLAIAYCDKISCNEWGEIVDKVQSIESETGSWPYGCGLKIRVRLASRQRWRFLLPVASMFECVCLFVRRKGGMVLRKIGLRKNYI